jgi:hypothetical protein
MKLSACTGYKWGRALFPTDVGELPQWHSEKLVVHKVHDKSVRV